MNATADDIARGTEPIDIFTAATDGSLTCGLVEILTRLPFSVKVSLWYRSDGPTSADRVEHPLRHHHTMLHPLGPVQESCIIADSIVWSTTRPTLGTTWARCCAPSTPRSRPRYDGSYYAEPSTTRRAPASTAYGAGADESACEPKFVVVRAKACEACAETDPLIRKWRGGSSIRATRSLPRSPAAVVRSRSRNRPLPGRSWCVLRGGPAWEAETR